MQAFQDALEEVLRHRPDVKGCSRTDSGVSAKMYCVSFKTESSIPCDKLVLALNVKLPKTVAVKAVREVDEDFHARYSSLGKKYCYRILNSAVRDPFCEGFALHCPYPKDIDADFLNMQAQYFVGEHDFKAFQNTGTDIEDTVRRIYSCEVVRKGELIEFYVSGNGFLYNMVRIMAGTLIETAKGVIVPDSIPDIIASKDRSRAGITAPACGLMLEEVFY